MTPQTATSRLGSASARIIIGLSVLVVAALLAAAYVWASRRSAPDPASLEPVTIATNTVYAGSCPIFVAQENGYFAAEGVLVTIQPHTSGKAALDASLAGQAHLGASADIPIMFAVMRGQPVTIVATIFSTEKDYEIVGRMDKGITTPASLRGKRIGVTLGTSGHFVLDAFLNRQKLSPSDVTVLDLKPEAIPPALARGDIDAASTWEPHVGTLKKQAGANGAVFSAHGIYDATFNVSGTRDYVTGHPDTVKKVLRALVSGGRFCKESPDKAREITARVMKTDAAELKEPWPSYRFGIALDQSLLLALEDETRWAIKNKLAGRNDVPNYLDNFHLEGLLAVTPGAVTVIH